MKMLPVIILAKYHSGARSVVSERPNSSARLVFPMSQLERTTRFRNVPCRACDLLSNVPIRARMIASSKYVYSAVFFTIIISFCHSMPFMSVLIVLIKA